MLITSHLLYIADRAVIHLTPLHELASPRGLLKIVVDVLEPLSLILEVLVDLTPR